MDTGANMEAACLKNGLMIRKVEDHSLFVSVICFLHPSIMGPDGLANAILRSRYVSHIGLSANHSVPELYVESATSMLCRWKYPTILCHQHCAQAMSAVREVFSASLPRESYDALEDFEGHVGFPFILPRSIALEEADLRCEIPFSKRNILSAGARRYTSEKFHAVVLCLR